MIQSTKIFLVIFILCFSGCNPWRSYRREPHVNMTVRMPLLHRTMLANGLTLYNLQERYVPVIRIRVAFKAGRTSVPPQKIASTFLLYEYLAHGQRKLLDEFGALGASPDFFLGAEESAIDVKVPSSEISRAFALIRDMLLNPNFDTNRLERVRRKLIAQLENTSRQPSTAAYEVLQKSLYGEGHPLGVSNREWIRSVRELSIEDLYHAYKEFIGPMTVSLITVGNLDDERMVKLCKAYFGSWKAPAEPPPVLALSQERLREAVWLVERPGLQRTYIAIGGLGVPFGADDEYPLEIAASSVNSRIFSHLFMKDISCTSGFHISKYRRAGHFILQCDVRREDTWEAVNEIMSAIFLLQMDDFSGRSMPIRRSRLILGLINPFHSLNGSVSQLSRMFWNGLDDDYYITSLQKITHITKENIEVVLPRYFDRDKIHIVLSGDPQAIMKDATKRFGPIKTVSP